MKNKKKISGIIFLTSLVAGLFMATQTFAKYTGYAKGLGNPLFIIGDIPVYFPFSYLMWVKRYGTAAPIANEKASSMLLGTIFISTFILFFINKKREKVTTHGSASFAEKNEIKEMKLYVTEKILGSVKYLQKENLLKKYKKMGMFEIYQENILNRANMNQEEKKLAEEEFYSDGVIIGRDKYGNNLIDDGPGHIILAAQTGSGKGVGLVIPTLEIWKGSSLINDIKGENWQLTAAYRKSIGHKVLKFEATSMNSCKYNPMAEIRKGTLYEWQEARNIAEIIISPDKQKDPFFGPMGMNFLTSVILHVLYMVKKRTANLTDVYKFLSSNISLEDRLNQMIAGQHNSDGEEDLFQKIYQDVIINKAREFSPRTHPVVSRTGAEFLIMADKQRSGIITTAKIELEIFADPIISRNVEHSDFHIKDLMNYDVPVDLYFVTPPKSIGITAVLMKLLINQIIFILTDEMDLTTGQNENYKHKLLLLIDEFPAIGKVELLHKALAYVRGYGMKMCLITQDLKQLNEIYGENNSILNNCKTQIFFTPSDNTTTKYIEEKLGKTTILGKANISWKGIKWFSDWNYSRSYMGRSLMTFSEIQQMSDDDSIIFITGQKPIKGKKIRWFNEKKFKVRQARATPLKESDKLY